METQRDLTRTSREDLLAIIAQQQTTIVAQQATIEQQQATIAQLQRRISALEARLSGRGAGPLPGNKPSSGNARPPKPARKRRPHGFARTRMPPTRTVQHAVETCPDCGTHLVGGWVQRTRQVIELPVVPVEVVEHQFIARECPLCRKRHVPKVALAGVVVGKQRLGVSLVSRIATLREVGRLPFATIQWYLETFHQLHLSVGGLVGVVHQAAKRAEPAVAALQEQIRASPVVHADETGWRQDGTNGYVWTFSTPTVQYFLRRGRTKDVVDEVLGDGFAGVLVSDFYAAYHHYPGVHQRCWPHLLRDIHALKGLYPDDVGLARWATAVHDLYQEATRFTSSDVRERQRMQRVCEERLLAVCRPFLDDPVAVQRTLGRRIQRHLKELFVFVADPSVPPDNNAAERSLRHLVTSRKISGGTRSDQGTTSKMTLASLFGTWRARGLNPFHECRQFLSSPHS